MKLHNLVKKDITSLEGQTLLIQPSGTRSGGKVVMIRLGDNGAEVIRADHSEYLTIGLNEEVDIVEDEMTELEASLTEIKGLLQDTVARIQGGKYGPPPQVLLELSGRCHHVLESVMMNDTWACVKLLRAVKAQRLAHALSQFGAR